MNILLLLLYTFTIRFTARAYTYLYNYIYYIVWWRFGAATAAVHAARGYLSRALIVRVKYLCHPYHINIGIYYIVTVSFNIIKKYYVYRTHTMYIIHIPSHSYVLPPSSSLQSIQLADPKTVISRTVHYINNDNSNNNIYSGII